MNKEKIRCFHAYSEAMVRTNEIKPVEGKICGIFSVRDTINIMLPDNSISVAHFVSDCALLLKPLLQISDEHMVEVARIALEKDKDWVPLRVDRYPDSYNEVVVRVEPDITDPETIITMVIRFWEHNSSINWIWEHQKANMTGVEKRHLPNYGAVIDYLRTKSYNIGYAQYSPADLLVMGWVVETKNEII